MGTNSHRIPNTNIDTYTNTNNDNNSRNANNSNTNNNSSNNNSNARRAALNTATNNNSNISSNSYSKFHRISNTDSLHIANTDSTILCFWEEQGSHAQTPVLQSQPRAVLTGIAT